MHCTHGPIQVPLTQLSPLSQTCLSCPNSVPPPPPFSPRSFLYGHFYLPKPCRSTSPNPLHFTSLFPWQSAGGVLFSFPGLRRGGQRCPSQPLCGRDILEMVWSASHGAIWSGGGRIWPWLFCSVEEHNGTTTPQRNAPPNCYYHKKRTAEPI